MDQRDIERILKRLEKEILTLVTYEVSLVRRELSEGDLEVFCNSISHYIDSARRSFMEMLEERKNFLDINLPLRIGFLSNLASALNKALDFGHPFIMGLAKLDNENITIIACLMRQHVSTKFDFLPIYAVPLFFCNSFQDLREMKVKDAKLLLNPNHVLNIIH